MPSHLSVHYNMNNNICFYFNPLVHAATIHVPVAECLKGVNRIGCKIEHLESKTARNDPLTPFSPPHSLSLLCPNIWSAEWFHLFWLLLIGLSVIIKLY